MSNADRQKRYRDSKRNAQSVTRVTERNAPEVTPEVGSGSTNADEMVVERGQSEVGQRTRTAPNPLADVSALDLQLRIKTYPGLLWKTSPEYVEVMRRLHTRTVAELEEQGQFIPCWKHAQEAVA